MVAFQNIVLYNIFIKKDKKVKKMGCNAKKNFEMIIAEILTIVFSAAFYFLGYFLRDIKIVKYFMIFIFIFIVFMLVLQVFKYEKFKKKNLNHSAAEQYKQVEIYQEKAQDFDTFSYNLKKKIIKFKAKSLGVLLFELLFVAFFGYFLDLKNIFCIIILTIIMYPLIYTLIKTSNNNQIKQKCEKYEEIDKIINQCKTKLNINKEVIPCYLPSDGLSVYEDTNKIYLMIGLYDLIVLTKEEFENALYHEMAHVHNEDTKISSIFLNEKEKMDSLINNIFYKELFFECIVVSQEIEMFLNFMQINKERIADKAILEYGEKQIYINGLAKVVISSFQDNYRFPINIYSEEQPIKNMISYVTEKRIENYYQNKEMYNHFLVNSLQRKFDTHPSFKERMKNLGVNDYVIDYNFDKQHLFYKDVTKAIQNQEKEMYESYKESWTTQREYNYLFYVNEYNLLQGREFSSLNPDEKFKYAYCVYEIEGAKQAYPYYLDLIKEYPNNVHILYHKSLIEYAINNEHCIEGFKQCIALDNTLSQELSMLIGSYLNNNGREDIIEDYRQDTIKEMQKAQDDNDYQIKNRKNLFVQHDLDIKLIDAIKTKVKEFPIIEKAYIIKQLINEQEYRYGLLIVFNKKASIDEKNKIMDQLFIFSQTLDKIYLDDITYSKYFKSIIKKLKIESLI